jgi:DNA-directed RNA polymerase specialized sigma24 family protein
MAVHEKLADQGLRRALAAMVRRRVPPHEVDEIVQATLADACAAKTAPTETDALERWVRGIARHKVADYHRRARREVPVESEELVAAHLTDGSAHDAADLLRWAEREGRSESENTIDWLLREGDGEKLESIARDANLPAARVRQRVSRLRRHFRARWAAQIAAALALGALAWFLLRPRERERPITPVFTAPVSVSSSAPPPPPPPLPDPAIELRRVALEQCVSKQWQACLDGLDQAAKLDPAGDTSVEVQGARAAAKKALAPTPKPKPAPKKSSGSKKSTDKELFPSSAY